MDKIRVPVDVSELSSAKRMLRVSDVVKLTGRSRRTIIRWLEREPGVISLFDHPETMHKRRHRTFLIPPEVFQRIIQRGKDAGHF
jgi:Winged helix-turn helix